MKIKVKEFVKKNISNFKGVTIETQDKFERILGEKKTGHWKANATRLMLANKIIIISKHEPGKVLIAEIKNVLPSKDFENRIVIEIKSGKIEKFKIPNGKYLLFSRNPISYF